MPGEQLAIKAAVAVPAGVTSLLRRNLPDDVVVLSRGDLVVALVASVTAAVDAALAVAEDGRTSAGVALGEVTAGERGTDGAPLDEAQALYERARATPGVVWITTLVADLARRWQGESRRVGPVAVAAGREIDAVELVGQRPPAANALPPLPAPLTVTPPFPFVARTAEQALLETAWAEAAAGVRHLALVGGEAGVGKSRLVAELARRLHDRGAIVLHGTCRQDVALPYEPLVAALEHLVAYDPSLLSAPGAQLGELRWVLPQASVAPATSTGDADSDRYWLFTAITAVLAEAGRRAPLLLVVEDVHWAGRGTLAMLAHLLRAATPLRLLVIATYRDTPAEVGAALRDALPELHRLGGVTRVRLQGLEHDDVRRFVAAAAGHEVGEQLEPVVEVLAGQTDGNPFLLGELWRHLAETGRLVTVDGRWRIGHGLDDADSPEGVRRVIDARLARLDPAVADVLAVASVIGSTFDVDLLAAAATQHPAVAMARLEDASGHGVVEPTGAGGYRFSHALVRAAVYDGLGAARRSRLHAEVVRSLAPRSDRPLGELAHHAIRAVPFIDAAEAIRHARRAADAARRAAAYDEAVRLLRAVLGLAADRLQRTELLLELSAAEARTGDVTAAQQTARHAADLADALGQTDLLTRAALAYEEAAWWPGVPSPAGEDLVRLALARAGNADPRDRVALRASLSRTLAFLGRDLEAREMAKEAESEARRLGDDRAIALSLQGTLFGLWPPEEMVKRIALADEVAELAVRLDDLDLGVRAATWRLYGRLYLGERGPLIDAFRTHATLERRAGQLFFRTLHLQAAAALALSDGRFAEAELLAAEADQMTPLQSGVDLSGAYGVQLFSIRREQGRLEEVRRVVELVAQLDRSWATWKPGLAALYAELGMLDEAAPILRQLVAHRLAAVPRDSLWCGSLSLLADTAIAVGDSRAAAAVYDELVAWQGMSVQVGNYLAAYGSVHRYLGGLAVCMQRWRDAAAHFERAIVHDAASESPVWLAHSRLDYARLLAVRRRSDDVERAVQLATDALATARKLGMNALAPRAQALLDELAAPAAEPPGVLTERELDVLRLIADGHSNKQVGEQLHLSPHTVAAHVRNILMKSGCSNRTEAATWAMRRGLTARR